MLAWLPHSFPVSCCVLFWPVYGEKLILVSFLAEESTGEQGNPQDFLKQYQNILTPLLFIGFILSSTLLGPREQKEVSLNQHFYSSSFHCFSPFSFFSRTSLVPYGVWVPCVLDCDRADIYVRTNFLQSWLAFYWEVEMKEQITLLVNEDTMIEGVQGRDWFWGIGFGTFMDGSGELV